MIKAADFDKAFTGKKPEKLWGAPAIAQALGVSEDTVRTWAKDGSAPIYRPKPRTYFAVRSELDAWLKSNVG